MKKTDIVFCAVTNSVLFAGDALFGADGRAYRPECAPDGAEAGAFDTEAEPEITSAEQAAWFAGLDEGRSQASANAAVATDEADGVDDEPAAGGNDDHALRADRRHGNRGR